MSSPDSNETEVGETTDRRLFDADGNVREDVAAERAESEDAEPELSLESLYAQIRELEQQTRNAMEQVDATFTQFGQELGQLTQQVRSVVSDMHVRIGVLEEIFCNPDLQADRDAMLAGEFNFERFKEIAEDIVLPEMKRKAEEAQAAMQERFAKIQAKIQSGMSPQDAIAAVQQETGADEGNTNIEIVSG